MTSNKSGQQARGRKRPAKADEIRIDREFKELIIPQTREERAQLERNLVADGRCRDALVVWKGERVLLDGHRRLEICKRLNLPYGVVEVELPDRRAALQWIRANQLGRRNLTPEAVSYLRGQHYNAEKQPHGGAHKGEEASGNDCHSKTAEVLGDRYKVAPKTIRNDGAFAEELDAITRNCGDDLKTALLRRETRLTRSQLKKIAGEEPDQQKKVVAQVLTGGRLIERKEGKATREMITVPVAPADLVNVLLVSKGRDYLRQVQDAIRNALETEQKEERSGRASRRPRTDVPRPE